MVMVHHVWLRFCVWGKKVEGNSRRLRFSTILYSISAVILFGIVFGFFFIDSEKAGNGEQAQIVMLGDSILGECRDETSIAAILAKRVKETVFNGGLGGTSMGPLDSELRVAYTKDCLSMYDLAKSIVAEDFGPQQTVRVREPATEYFAETIDALEKIDFSEVDILFIGHGINDYHSGVPISNEENPYDPHTFTGALRSAVTALQAAYPELRIILLTPTYSWYVFYDESEQTCENNDFGGGVLEDYVNAEIELAESMNIEIIDLYHDFYTHEQWNEWETYTNDGLHPNKASRHKIAFKIHRYLKAN